MAFILERSIQYWFEQFHNGNVDEESFIESLVDAEQTYKELNDEPIDSDKDLWFRFFKGDTQAHTIGDIERNLNPQTSTPRNREHLLECIKIAAEEKSLQINFS